MKVQELPRGGYVGMYERGNEGTGTEGLLTWASHKKISFRGHYAVLVVSCPPKNISMLISYVKLARTARTDPAWNSSAIYSGVKEFALIDVTCHPPVFICDFSYTVVNISCTFWFSSEWKRQLRTLTWLIHTWARQMSDSAHFYIRGCISGFRQLMFAQM